MSDLISDGGMDSRDELEVLRTSIEVLQRRKQEEIQRGQSPETLKEKIAIVIDSWDNLGCPDSTRTIKRYMNDNEFYRKVNHMFMMVYNNERTN